MSKKLFIELTKEQLELVISGLSVNIDINEEQESIDTNELLEQYRLIYQLEYALRVNK